MNLLQMQYFLAVAESGLLIATAEKLHISPSALSKTINRLESDLGVRLFERSNTGMVLTEAGILARDTMSEALAMLEERQKARKEKNWAEADRLRDALKAMGFAVEDTAQGPKLKKL